MRIENEYQTQINNNSGSNIDSKSLFSSAYPPNKPIQQHSIFHKILKSAKQITNNITTRPFQSSDIIQVRHLQLQWFPLNYGDYFYNRLLGGNYNCLVTQTEVIIEWDMLKIILKDKYLKQKSIFEKQIHSGQNRKLALIQPSKYFQKQGIKFQYLLKNGHNSSIVFNQQKQQPKSEKLHINVNCEVIGYEKEDYKSYQPDNKQQIPKNIEPLMKVKVIVGILVFDITPSNGYVNGSWWQEFLFGTNNSIYINTIGVIPQFRKNGIARKMLQQLKKKTQQQKHFKLIHLHVIQYNIAAINLYHKIGFQQFQQISNYYNIDAQYYSAKLLGMFTNGGKKKVSWSEWFSSFWK